MASTLVEPFGTGWMLGAFAMFGVKKPPEPVESAPVKPSTESLVMRSCPVCGRR